MIASIFYFVYDLRTNATANFTPIGMSLKENMMSVLTAVMNKGNSFCFSSASK